mgnify:CR=1 FL=1
MANNTYGIVKQALFNPESDADIYYHYKPTRSSVETTNTGFIKVKNVATMLENAKLDASVQTNYADRRLPGMYTLKLPATIFANKGIYTIYIVPKEINCTIKDVGALAAYPDIRGIVIDLQDVTENAQLFKDDNLTGYRIEYYDMVGDGNLQRQDYFRIITSSNSCDPISQNLTSSNTGSNGYRYNTNGSLSFITLTPSTAPSFKSNSKHYIGTPNKKIVIKNTKFDPVCVEIEVTEHDIETVSYMLEGEQVRNFDNGRVTTYNFDGEIYKQFEFVGIKDNYTTREKGEMKLDKSGNIDRSLNLAELKGING